mmetsp:Transcript_8284/g.18091  ORF Transcript_8284/g.18091 Transcript_8284/m.18091 type:complete len:405 (-) Transcript_8284:82-1296(-)|eukprot:CAMPEP_0170597738 /NCGR_PEP_ID=MMETSP0224-20130122/15865_1 /TAXON_ID=285029 /ORGANISM="Togula jolla, Strain CCCM 725" /LENGTH=404 /DNA_ID=CAMNT_0010922225 /DNA_START=39 /DNA_END=1253 /DNA_ORIENTATION=-
MAGLSCAATGEADGSFEGTPQRTLFRPSRTSYPGSRFGPKTRYDLPRRHKAYGNGDEDEAILFEGTNLEPHAWATWPPVGPASTALQPLQKRPGALGEAARSILHPLADRNLPELPLIDFNNDTHGVLVIGGKGCGKTSLILSFIAAVTGSYPSRRDADIEAKRRSMPAFGQVYELPEREVKLGNGSAKMMRVVMTDTPPSGVNSREEQPLCATVSPNSVQHFSAVPSWMRIAMRGGKFPHYSVLCVIDGHGVPLWEDGARCRDLARLLAVLRRSQYTVVMAVTKLWKARKEALRAVAHGGDHNGRVGQDPRTSYEAYSWRYLEKVCAALQAKASENEWSFSQGPDSPSFPLVNATIFDVPTWASVGDHKTDCQRNDHEQPTAKYATSQLKRLLLAACVRSHSE